MKAKQVLNLLKIHRQTLSRYVSSGIIKVTKLPNNQYDYEDNSVFKIYNKTLKRKSVVYCRVSTSKQKQDLINQENLINEFCISNGIIISDTFKDVGSGINFDRKEFQRLLNCVINYEIECVYITYKDRLSRISFQMFKSLFENFNCKIVVLNEIDDTQLIEKEIFREIIDLIHCFAMKMYSNRRKEKLKIIEKDLELEDATNI